MPRGGSRSNTGGPRPNSGRPATTMETLILKSIKQSNGCWDWQGNLNSSGYGVISYLNRQWRAHRLSYFFSKGDPQGMYVCHNCDNPKCINPDHLWLGTAKDNSQDMVSKGRSTRHNQILTEEQARDIKFSKETYKDLAIKYNISLSTISSIKSNKNWKHIKEQN